MIATLRINTIIGAFAAATLSFAMGFLAHAEQTPQDAAKAEQIAQAVAFIENFTDQSNTILNDEASDEPQRIAAFMTVLADTLAAKDIGNHMITEVKGELSQEQYQRYQTIFPNYITSRFAKQFSEQFAKLLSQPMTIKKTRAMRRDVYIGSSFSRPNGAPVAIIWRVRAQEDDTLRILDIRVAGISQWKAIRDEFTTIVKSQGADVLLDLLQEQTETPAE